MTLSRWHLTVGAASVLWVFVIAASVGPTAQEPEGNYGVGIPDVFLTKYLRYRTQQLNSSQPHVLRIRLGYVKGLSRSFTAMIGETAINLGTGAFEVRLNGLTPGLTYSVWLVDRSESDGIVPDVVKLATVLAGAPTALLTGTLGLNLPLGFTIDQVVVAPGVLSSGEPLAAGSVNVFQKIFFRRLTLVNEATGANLFDETTPPPALFALIPDLAAETDALLPLASPIPDLPLLGFAAPSSELETASSAGSSGKSVKLDKLISQGATFFFKTTFDGNGRTCGTCHPARNNLTIDPEFIATLPPDDPLFVAEFNPALTELERPALMRSDGLILENLDGFSPSSRFVMRGVPHTLGLQVSLERDTVLVDPNPPAPPETTAPAEMTGWSGDGAPGTGSLREFAIGAVTQHFTKTLERRVGLDFTLPSEHQLDAMEAFQLSLGRDADFNLSSITFNDPNVRIGQDLFVNGTDNPTAGGTCGGFCHTNAGARVPNFAGLQNRNFNTNVEGRTHPARIGDPDPNFPKDGGFGRHDNGDGTFGNRTFNTAPVVEAADTAPFFHNNVVSTLEDVVRFYTREFNDVQPDDTTRFSFTEPQIAQIADFMRAVNALQNIDVARRELAEILALNTNPRGEMDTRLQTAFDDTQDAIDVLTQGDIFPLAVTKLTEARNLIGQARQSNDSSQRRALAQKAIESLDAARSEVATVAP